ncbi:MAG: NAD(P)/FAD-dependent oxidoreductase [Clostridia bacterium]
MSKVLIIGGGAAGLLAAISAAREGAAVTLLERNEKLGKKLYITGKGRCNVTNACEAEAFRRSVVKNPRFLYSALAAFPPSALMALLESLGCPVKVERGERVFPQSEKASDVSRVLERELRRLNVRVELNALVRTLEITDGRCTGVLCAGGARYAADTVIVCTGGQSYPSTGSTGDGFGWLAACGHTVFPPLPSLIPLECGAAWVRELQGLSLKNVRLTLTQGKKTLFSDIGELLFTHFGLSGPLVLSASAYMAELAPSDVALTLDLKPGLSEQQLDARLLRDIEASSRKQLRNLLSGLYPARLADAMPALCGVDGMKPVNELTREERARLAAAAKALRLPVTGTRPLSEAVVTRGGLDVREVDPKTMESKRVSGLYIAGELLDVDALTGGFNLHIAFATGMLAGRAAAQDAALSQQRLEF